MVNVLLTHLEQLRQHVVSATLEQVTITPFSDALTQAIVLSSIYHALDRGDVTPDQLITFLNSKQEKSADN